MLGLLCLWSTPPPRMQSSQMKVYRDCLLKIGIILGGHETGGLRAKSGKKVTVTGWGGSSKLCIRKFTSGWSLPIPEKKQTPFLLQQTSQRETSEVVTIEVRNRREKFTGSKWCSQVYWDILLSEDLWHWQFWNKMKALHQNYDFTRGFSICLMVKIINLINSPIKSLKKKTI